jgi:hypothetical protein
MSKLEERAGKMKPPFPRKFRVGDKCVVVEGTQFFNEGDIVTITNVMNNGTYKAIDRCDNPEWHIAECRLRILEPREELNTSNKASDSQIGGSHYAKLPIQPMEYCLKNGLNYAQSNSIKYITRYKDKNGIEDLKKAIHCIELLIEHEQQSCSALRAKEKAND